LARGSMAARAEFGSWLDSRLDALQVDRDVYGTYICSLLEEEESEAERLEVLRATLSAVLVRRPGGSWSSTLTYSLTHSLKHSLTFYYREKRAEALIIKVP
uniref:Coiled-coil domain-containing protein 43 n=1 Tax=Astyanax mexicanus TaxID=7994 RepID=A0A8B9H5T7_ASTMX